MNIQTKGYKYDQYYFKDDEKQQSERIIKFYYSQLSKIGFSNFFEDGILDEQALTISQIEDIISWKKGTSLLENISHKFLMIREVKMIKELIKELDDQLLYLKTERVELFSKLREEFSKNIQENSFLNNYFKFSDFKNKFELETADKIFNTHLLFQLKKESLFDLIRRKIISSKIQAKDLFSKKEKINISDIYHIDEDLYELLRIEFFSNIVQKSLGFKVNIGKKTHTEVIKAFDKAGQTLNLTKTEIGYLTTSLEPIPKIDLKEGDNIEFGSGLKFDVVGKKESYKIDMFYELVIDNNLKANLIVPIYFSYIRCKLVKEQRSSD